MTTFLTIYFVLTMPWLLRKAMMWVVRKYVGEAQ